jgi:hypothetical protein
MYPLIWWFPHRSYSGVTVFYFIKVPLSFYCYPCLFAVITSTESKCCLFCLESSLKIFRLCSIFFLPYIRNNYALVECWDAFWVCGISLREREKQKSRKGVWERESESCELWVVGLLNEEKERTFGQLQCPAPCMHVNIKRKWREREWKIKSER